MDWNFVDLIYLVLLKANNIKALLFGGKKNRHKFFLDTTYDLSRKLFSWQTILVTVLRKAIENVKIQEFLINRDSEFVNAFFFV